MKKRMGRALPFRMCLSFVFPLCDGDGGDLLFFIIIIIIICQADCEEKVIRKTPL